MGFGTIFGVRHPLGDLEYIPHGKEETSLHGNFFKNTNT